MGTEPVSTITSKLPSLLQSRAASPWRVWMLAKPCAWEALFRFLLQVGMDFHRDHAVRLARQQHGEITAAVPISSTRSPGWTWRACTARASTLGDHITSPWPSGISMSTKASD